MEQVAKEQEEKRKVDAHWDAYHQRQAVPSNEKLRHREARPVTASQKKQIERLATVARLKINPISIKSRAIAERVIGQLALLNRCLGSGRP